MNEPLPSSEVKRFIIAILDGGILSFSDHAYDEMDNDNLTEVDVRNCLRGGVARAGEFEKGSWRYRVDTTRIAVVIAFRSEDRAVVITAWRMN